MWQVKSKGSVTVFVMLSLLLVVSCVLTLLEGARMHELHRLARWRSVSALEGTFGNYSSRLWEQYHLLACEQGEMEEIMIKNIRGAYGAIEYGDNLLLLRGQGVRLKEYTLLTDGNGKVYIDAVSSYMSRNVAYETVRLVYNQYEAIKALLDQNNTDGDELEKAIESLQTAEKQQTRDRPTRSGTLREAGNLLEVLQRLRKTQILELVIEDTSLLSEVAYQSAGFVSKRTRMEGVRPVYQEPDWLDRGLLQQYLLTYLSDYTHPAVERGFFYELEYLIGGKDNDVENLREAAEGLLLIREAANLAYLMTDTEKLEQVRLLALALAGASANPVVIGLVEAALLSSWAFAESVLDVRALLMGKKIPLVKSKELWTMSLENIADLSRGWWVAKESKAGLEYKGYLGILLLLQNDRNLAYRAMDVQELTLQKMGDSCRMDALVVYAKAEFAYRARPIFMDVEYEINKTVEYGYR